VFHLRRHTGHRRSPDTDACRYFLDAASAAFAITRGSAHTLISANPSFLALVGAERDAVLGRSITEVLSTTGLPPLLDRAFNHKLPVRGDVVGGSREKGLIWTCSAWPLLPGAGQADGLVVELREQGPHAAEASVHRMIAERLLLGALHEKSVAEAAETSRERAHFLAESGRLLARSINEAVIHQSLAELYLPGVGSWCIVDLVEADGSLRRLAIVHPDPSKQTHTNDLKHRWSPEPGDPFGVGAMLRTREPVAVTRRVAAAFAAASHSPYNRRMLQRLGIGSVLTVPLLSHGRLLGAITFVADAPGRSFTQEEVDLARELALRGALALDNARLYSGAHLLTAEAQRVSQIKSEFLGHISHELRTPLDVIGGYIDLLDLEIHGGLTEAQHSDLDRIRRSQQHLLVMINDILNFIQTESGTLSYRIADLPAHSVLSDAIAAVEPLLIQKQLVHRVSSDAGILVRADTDRTHQILVNLLTNAVKFTPPGGEITVECHATEDTAIIDVIDTGIGIPPDRVDAVFEPFVQARSRSTDEQGGVGLGLAISRQLARAMHGDISAQSTLGHGSRFSLSLPRAQHDRQARLNEG
jgi:signal transduction histidine kinase